MRKHGTLLARFWLAFGSLLARFWPDFGLILAYFWSALRRQMIFRDSIFVLLISSWLQRFAGLNLVPVTFFLLRAYVVNHKQTKRNRVFICHTFPRKTGSHRFIAEVPVRRGKISSFEHNLF